MSHLRRYLERTAALPADELDMALRRQQIYGGSLDTVLLELDLVDAHTLGELLVHACGLPLTPFELIDDERDRPWHLLPEEILEIGWAVPLVERGDQVWIAVHPDLPNERLGALYRSVPNVHPFVIPECCLEKIAAERSASVVPQRYAVLCVAYLSALRRRPSMSDVGFPMLHDAGSGGSAGLPLDLPPPRAVMVQPPGDDTDRAPLPVREALRVEAEDEFERRATVVFEPVGGHAAPPERAPIATEPEPLASASQTQSAVEVRAITADEPASHEPAPIVVARAQQLEPPPRRFEPPPPPRIVPAPSVSDALPPSARDADPRSRRSRGTDRALARWCRRRRSATGALHCTRHVDLDTARARGRVPRIRRHRSHQRRALAARGCTHA